MVLDRRRHCAENCPRPHVYANKQEIRAYVEVVRRSLPAAGQVRATPTAWLVDRGHGGPRRARQPPLVRVRLLILAARRLLSSGPGPRRSVRCPQPARATRPPPSRTAPRAAGTPVRPRRATAAPAGTGHRPQRTPHPHRRQVPGHQQRCHDSRQHSGSVVGQRQPGSEAGPVTIRACPRRRPMGRGTAHQRLVGTRVVIQHGSTQEPT